MAAPHETREAIPTDGKFLNVVRQLVKVADAERSTVPTKKAMEQAFDEAKKQVPALYAEE